MNNLLTSELNNIQTRIDDARKQRDLLRRPAVRKALAKCPDGDYLSIYEPSNGTKKWEIVVNSTIWNPDDCYIDQLSMIATRCTAESYVVSEDQTLLETRTVRIIVRTETRCKMPKSDQKLLRSLGKIHTERSVRKSVVCAA